MNDGGPVFPIVFSAEQMRLFIHGNQTQMRRPVYSKLANKSGDFLWVCETWRVGAWNHEIQSITVDYFADGFVRKEWLYVPNKEQFELIVLKSLQDGINAGFLGWEPRESPCSWQSSKNMPQWAARFWLRIKHVRIERLQAISEADALAEGMGEFGEINGKQYPDAHTAPQAFARFWDDHYEEIGDGWKTNPKVYVIEFERVGMADAMLAQREKI